PKRVSASRGLPPQYFSVISASKARRFGPLICDAARRRSAICDGLSDGRHSSVESCMHMIGPLERHRVNFPARSFEHAYSSIVISFPEIALGRGALPATAEGFVEGDQVSGRRTTALH